MNKKLVLTGALGIVAAAVGLWSGSQLLQPEQAVVLQQYSVATIFPHSRPLPAVALVDQDGRSFGVDRLQGQWSLLFMGFTNCGHVCPMTMARMRAIADEVEYPLNVLFVSVDPGRDTPEVIAEYVRRFDEDFTGVTGEAAEIDKLAAALGAPYVVEISDDKYIVDHSSAIFLIGPDGGFRGVTTAPHDVNKVAADLNQLFAEMGSQAST